MAKGFIRHSRRAALGLATAAVAMAATATGAPAAPPPGVTESLAACHAVPSAAARLGCYDALAAEQAAGPTDAKPTDGQAPKAPQPAAPEPAGGPAAQAAPQATADQADAVTAPPMPAPPADAAAPGAATAPADGADAKASGVDAPAATDAKAVETPAAPPPAGGPADAATPPITAQFGKWQVVSERGADGDSVVALLEAEQPTDGRKMRLWMRCVADVTALFLESGVPGGKPTIITLDSAAPEEIALEESGDGRFVGLWHGPESIRLIRRLAATRTLGVSVGRGAKAAKATFDMTGTLDAARPISQACRWRKPSL